MDAAVQPTGRDLVLDFWRGVGILMVIAHHAVYFHFGVFRNFVASVPVGVFEHALWWMNQALVEFSERAGPLGVKFFFVVSGYIITYLMLREEEKHGRLRIGAFYIRRVFRILPPYLFYLFSVMVFAAFSWIVILPADALTASAFLCNTALPCGWFTVHTWTLAVEMQFYVLWPLLFIVLPSRYRAPFLAATLALLCIASASGAFLARGWIDNALSFACIALGALCATHAALRSAFERRGLWYIGSIVFVIAGVYALGFEEGARVAYRITTPIMVAALIFSTYRFRWLIETRVFTAVSGVGLVSYSLYLWQQVFTAPAEYYLAPSPLQYIILMVVFGLFSYFAIEKPFVRLGKVLIQRRALRATLAA